MGPRTLASRRLAGVTLEAVEGDITALNVEAITNAANNQLWMGAGVAGAIKRRGGASIEEEAVSKGPVPVGSAVETDAGDLEATYVLHAAVMGPDLRTDIATVARTTRSVLQLADRLGVGSVAMPLLGTGVGGLDLSQVARAMADQVAEVARRGGCDGMRVLLVGLDERAASAVREAVEAR